MCFLVRNRDFGIVQIERIKISYRLRGWIGLDDISTVWNEFRGFLCSRVFKTSSSTLRWFILIPPGEQPELNHRMYYSYNHVNWFELSIVLGDFFYRIHYRTIDGFRYWLTELIGKSVRKLDCGCWEQK